MDWVPSCVVMDCHLVSNGLGPVLCSNGLGPVLSGNATWPVINCPHITPDWGTEDIWSSLRLPSGK